MPLPLLHLEQGHHPNGCSRDPAYSWALDKSISSMIKCLAAAVHLVHNIYSPVHYCIIVHMNPKVHTQEMNTTVLNTKSTKENNYFLMRNLIFSE